MCSHCLQNQARQVPTGTQQATHPGFVAPDVPYDCGACTAHHGAQYGFPPLDHENVQAFGFYQLVQSQVRVAGMGEIIGLDFGPLFDVLRTYRVPESAWRELFEKILICDQETNAYRKRASEHQREKVAAEKAMDSNVTIIR